MSEVLGIVIIWTVLFTLQKILTLYISIHYHYRADGNRIEKSKRMRGALITLYEASTALYPAFSDPFRPEDMIICRDSGGSDDRAATLYPRLGITVMKVRDRLKSVMGIHNKPSMFRSASSHVIVNRALEHQSSSAALAKRLWRSLVPKGHTTLTARDIIKVLGTHKRVEAEEAFKIIDENENGDVTLSEMILTILETSSTHRAVCQGMTDINRAINTLDWIGCALITMIVIVYTGMSLYIC